MTIIFATNNIHKLAEVADMLPNIELLGLKDIGCSDDIPETADTLAGNALLKARYVKQKYGYDCFADDTGLEVQALNNAPGVYSARYAGEAQDAEANIRKLLEEMRGVKNRKARFRTVVALVTEKEERLFEGEIQGTLAEQCSGSGGFGYDPIFIPSGYPKTFADLPVFVKNAISHRAMAIAKLAAYISGR